MKIVEANTCRELRALTEIEVDALRRYWCGTASFDHLATVTGILDEIRPTSIPGNWIACDCHKAGRAPMLHSVLRQRSRFLRRAPGEPNTHQSHCVFFDDDRIEQSGAGYSGSRSAAPDPLAIRNAIALPLLPKTFMQRILPFRKGPRQLAPESSVNGSSLAAILKHLLEAAGFNRIGATVVPHKVLELKQHAHALPGHGKRSLANLMICNPQDVASGLAERRLDGLAKVWSKNEIPALLVIGKVLSLSGDARQATLEGWEESCGRWHRTEVAIHANAPITFPSNKGNKFIGPGIGAFILAKTPTLGLTVLRAYVQPVLDDTYHNGNWKTVLMPVDSDAERRTLRGILKHLTPALEVFKPLVDIRVDGEACRPDFCVFRFDSKTPQNTLVIETMGDTSCDYAAQKEKTHRIMARLGTVYEDHRTQNEAGANQALKTALLTFAGVPLGEAA